jgi:predicted transposase YbfD/YdcC
LSCQHATSAEPAGNPDGPPGHDDGDLDGYRSLLECLEAVPEPRRRHGIRHRLAVVLAFAVAAVLAGADSVTAISEWAAEVPAEVLAALGARWDRRGRRRVAPSPATFRRVLKRVDATAVAAAFGTWLAGQLAAASPDLDGLIVALDGKTMRGARSAQEKAPHLLAAMICGARAVIAQRDVDQKTNEITQVKPLLAEVDLRGALVTADAMHVQRETARYLVEDKHADYLFTSVKDNQPGLFAVLDALDWPAAPIAHTAADRGHDRDETRTLQVLPAPPDCFPHAAQAFLIERTVRDPHTGQLRSAAAALGITSRSPERGGTPTLIATAARSHWDIEALHHVRDVTMHEDAHRLRAGSAAPVMATLRNTAIATLRMIGFTRTAQGRRWAARDATRTVAALGLTI